MPSSQTLAVFASTATSLPAQARGETNIYRSLRRRQKIPPRERRAADVSGSVLYNLARAVTSFAYYHTQLHDLFSFSQTPCEYNVWHPEPNNSDGCSNSPEYPPEWESITVLFHPTFKECCDYFRGDENCVEYNVCVDASAITSDNVKCGQWHPDMNNKDGCSNSMDYPPDWEGHSEYFFETAKECCDMFGTAGDQCKARDVCAGGPPKVTTISMVDCDNVPWHPDMQYQDGCSNSLKFPEAWSGNPFYFFDTPEECCDRFFVQHGKPCKTYESCNAMVSLLEL